MVLGLLVGQEGNAEGVQITYIGGYSHALVVNSYKMHVTLKGSHSVKDINEKVDQYIRSKLYPQYKIPSFNLEVATDWYYYNQTTDETEAGVKVIIMFTLATSGTHSDVMYYPEKEYLSSLLEKKQKYYE